MSKMASKDAIAALKVDLAGFHKQMAVSLKKVKKQQEAFIKKVGFAVLRGVIFRTPVDTGRARAGWHVEDTKTTFSVVNRVNYIVYLEAGHSQQAPSGMAMLTINDIRRKLQQGKIK